MFFSKSTIVALAAIFTAAGVSAAPAPAEAAAEVSVTVTLCAGSWGQGCVNIPVIAENCRNLIGGLTFLNDQVSTARIPEGFVCTLFDDFGCSDGGVRAHDSTALTGGIWNMSRVQGIWGTQNFNDLTSSFSCSPVS